MDKKCHSCQNSIFNENYHSFYSSYYRNKSTRVYFCSEQCLNKFNVTKKCKFCNYSSDLINTDSGFMVCTSNEYWIYSCAQKYDLRKKYNLDLT